MERPPVPPVPPAIRAAGRALVAAMAAAQLLSVTSCVLLFGDVRRAPVIAVEEEGLKPDTERIERITRRTGMWEPEGVFRLTVPRDDVTVHVGGVRVTPELGMASWAAFKRFEPFSVVTGRLIVLPGQANPMIDTLLAGGLEVTALYPPFLGADPMVWAVDFQGKGDEDKLSAGVAKAFEALEKTASARSFPPATRGEVDPTRRAIEPWVIKEALGVDGTQIGPVYEVRIGRPVEVKDVEIGRHLGAATILRFAGSRRDAVVTGQLVVAETAMQGVLQALRKRDVAIVGIENLLAGESPPLVAIRIWGLGALGDLARAMRMALDA